MKPVQGTIAAIGLLAGVAGAASADSVFLQMQVRDFSTGHADFEPELVSGGVVTDVVEALLGPDGKPVGNPDKFDEALITSTETFNQWFRGVEGVNIDLPRSFEFRNDLPISPDPRVWSINDSTFFPIDGEGFGNEGNANNYHFTAELHTKFIYDGGDPITLKYRSDDDLWVFINGQRIVDMGGVRRAQTSTFILDADSAAALGLEIGGQYDFDLFYAERRTQEAVLRADVLIPSPATAALVLLGAGAIGGRRRRH